MRLSAYAASVPFWLSGQGDDDMAQDRADQDDRLRRIADILGLPVESFAEGPQPEHLDGGVQCLLLWQQLESADGRRRALDALKRIAADERSRRKPSLTIVGRSSAPPVA